MADFDVLVTSGAEAVDWLDPSSGGLPSRLNSRPGYPQKRLVGAVGAPIVLKAVVDGVVAPLDAALGGRLFVAWTVEAPVLPFVGIAGSFGQSSMQTVTPNQPGHYTIGVRRPDGGLVHVHLDVA